jgi:uncharacterized protein (DUF1501 family)
MSTRRDFLKQSALATAGTMLIPGFLKAFDGKPLLPDHKKLVVIQLSGGNDGLNTIIPYRNDLYYKMRPKLAVASASVLRADQELGFHPALNKLNSLYDKGYLGVINNVGYPNPDRSHFRSMDIWHTASDSNEYWHTGWLGRYLDAQCKNCSTGHQAIEIDDVLGLALKGEQQKGMAVRNPKRLYDALQRDLFQKLSQQQEHDEPMVSYLYKSLAETISSADYIYSKSTIARSKITYPDSEFANRLKTIAQLINSGIDTRVYYASLSGFDTHVNQANSHERLLLTYSEAIAAFVADLEAGNNFDSTLIITFSEFGRRVAQNASGGTDHGTANNLFLIGKSLKQKGFINETPNLEKLDAGDLIHTIDFRSVYATVLDRWLGSEADSVLGGKFSRLEFI